MDEKYKCRICNAPATIVSEHDGCNYCGGADCGDGASIVFYCDQHGNETMTPIEEWSLSQED